MYHERLKYQKVTNTIQNGRLKCQTCSKYRAKWKVNMPKCSKYHAKCRVLVPNCCKYMANGTRKHIPQKKQFFTLFQTLTSDSKVCANFAPFRVNISRLKHVLETTWELNSMSTNSFHSNFKKFSTGFHSMSHKISLFH